MAKLDTKKQILIIGVALLGIGMLVVKNPFISFSSKDILKGKKCEEKTTREGREPWITIFVHGSFGSLLGFLNVSQVCSDDIEGTAYKKTVGKMRKDQFFYREQPLLDKGLIRVNPSFDLHRTGGKKFAVYPLLKTYDELTEYIRPGREQHTFYTFGWSGLLSQKRRCLEAIRFYNQLSEELAQFEKQGICPKIRILTHSHGGNVIAYLGAIHEVLNGRDFSKEKSSEKRNEYLEAIKSVSDRLKQLPRKKKAKKKKNQKRWDYKPENKGICIDELILWGMPVQPETDCLFVSRAFKSVYHFYSDEDLVQRIDWISTKKGYSDRRFNMKRLCKILDVDLWKEKKRLVQARVTVNRTVTKKNDKGADNTLSLHDGATIKNIKKEGQDLQQQESFWKILFSGGSFVTPSSEDPTHKELWFFSWKDKAADTREFVLAPFPVAIFSPLFVSLIQIRPDLDDVDINITKSGDRIEFGLINRDTSLLQGELVVTRRFLDGIKEKLEPWKPKDVSLTDIFSIVRRYADYL